MDEAARGAAIDAEDPSLLADADLVAVPEGSWSYKDPARLLARRWGAEARTTLAGVGILQQDLIGDTCARLAAGEIDVAVVLGGEARHSGLPLGSPDGQAESSHLAGDLPPDRSWLPISLGIHDLELERNIVVPSTAYALIERALSARKGRDAKAEREEIGRIYQRFSEIAGLNPHAWDRTRYTAGDLTEPSPSNRMIAAPYTKRLCSQWNVDQAAALVLCSAAEASRRAIPRQRWVFPWHSTVANEAVPLLQRRDLGACPAVAHVAADVLGAVGAGPESLGAVELYSCFPVAVQLLAEGFGFSLTNDRPGTLVGGMSFAGAR